jgi:ABC-type multidrug transport system ATPase subunit
MRPRLAILDEPDSGIDVLSLGEIAMLIKRLALGGTAILLITHREELAETADVASIMCAGSVIFTGGPLEARQYFTGRCMPHLESFGSQPWDLSDPTVKAALLNNEAEFLVDRNNPLNRFAQQDGSLDEKGE